MSKLKWAQLVLIVHTYAIAFAAHAYAANPQHIDILAGDLTTALESLARQSDIELVYRIEQLKGLRTRGVSGTLTSTQALTKLLEGTSLVIRTDASGAILISPSASNSGVPPSGGASPVSNTTSTTDANWLQHHLVLARAGDDSSNAASGRAPAAIANADAGSGAHLEEIVVTAEKYETDVQKTAVSIAVLSGDEVARRGEQQLDQVLAMVGAVKVLQGQDGPTFYIRGVGTGVPSSIGDPEINLNVDGVYQSEPQFSRAGLYDVNRIEVLRGPQGTIYGRN